MLNGSLEKRILTAKYITDNFDTILQEYSDKYPAIFGHSDKYASMVGYWCFAINYYASGFCLQIMVGPHGRFSRIYDPDSNWSEWK